MAGFVRSLKIQGYILVRSRRWKKFLSKLYGWGASVVILGALFKINHYAYADIMLLIGLGTEAIIFFFSAFEPPFVEPDWSLVHPEFTEAFHGKEAAKLKGITKTGAPTRQLDNMLHRANIDDKLINSLGDGLRNLSDNTGKLKDVSNAALASNDYAEKAKAASVSLGELDGAYRKTSETLITDAAANEEFSSNVKVASGSISELAKSYDQAAQNMKSDLAATEDFADKVNNASESVQQLANNYQSSAEKIKASAETLDFSGTQGISYNEQLGKIANNLSSLNQLYELQLQSSNRQVESSAKMQETMNQFLINLTDSADSMISYKQNMDELNKKMAALNKVYANMLSAMNVNK